MIGQPASALAIATVFDLPHSAPDFALHILQRVLDAHVEPMLVIDPSKRVLLHNAAAKRVLRAKQGLSQRRGRISIDSPQAEASLQRAIASVGDSIRTSSSICRGVRVLRHKAARDWLLLIHPLHTTRRESESLEPLFLVQVIGRARPRVISPEALRDLFSLSKREIAVVTMLLRTGTAEATARGLALSPETVRSHLKRIFRKCAVHSKTELMSLLHSIAQFTAPA